MTIDEIFERLYELKGKEYEIYKRGLPDNILQNIAHLCEIFETSSADVRRSVISKVVREISFVFLKFSDVMANTAVWQADKKDIVRGLEALAIENCIVDWRDSTLRLVLLYHSALKIGADPRQLIDFVARLATKSAERDFFGSFLARSAEDRQLEKFGIKEAKTPTGEFTYSSVH